MIIYFSGTGNSFSVAKKLATATGDTAVPLIRIKENPDNFDLAGESRIGVVFPVYYGDIPKPVEDLFRTVKLDQHTYFYAVATCGGSFGNSLYHLREILRGRVCDLSYGRVSYMIANSTATWKKNVSYDYHRLDKEDPLVQEVARAVDSRLNDHSMMQSTIMGKIASSDFVKRMGMKRFLVTVNKGACVGCGICMKICPAHNIEIQHGKALVGNRCAHCMACVHNCPHGGMMVSGHPIKKENQYRHPEVALKDLMLR